VKIVMRVAAGLVAVASLVPVAACGDKAKDTGSAGATATSAAPVKSVSPTEQLTAAATKTAAGSYTFKVTSNEINLQGGSDPAGPKATATADIAAEGVKVKIETLFNAGTLLVRVSGLPLPGFDGKKWLKVDQTKLKGGGAISPDDVKDPTGLAGLPSLIGQVTSTDGKAFKGTLDLTKANWSLADEDTVKGLGDQAKAVPFDATVDDKGYLAALKVHVPAFKDTKADEIGVAYDGFGAPVAIPTPAASEVMDAPATAYSLLNGA
jgi:hypothetical protein